MGFLIVLTLVITLNLCLGVLTLWGASWGAKWVGLAARFFPSNAQPDSVQRSVLHAVSALEALPWVDEQMQKHSGGVFGFTQNMAVQLFGPAHMVGSTQVKAETFVNRLVFVGDFLRSVEDELLRVGVFAVLVSSLVAAIVIVRLVREMPNLIRRARRGLLSQFEPQVELIEPYIAAHVMCFVLQQVLVEGLFILLVAAVCSIDHPSDPG